MQQVPIASWASLALASLVTAAACTSGTGSTGAQSSDSALASLGQTLQCAPSAGQLAACLGSDAGASCTLALCGDAGTALPGTCHPTLDGTQMACLPNPPAPPADLVDACSGKGAGDACTAPGKFGDTFQGTCLTALGTTTLFCRHVHSPPAAAVTACANADAGDACTRPGRWGWDAGARPGVCSTGPADAGPLACVGVHPSEAPGVAACSGLDAGASCTLGFKHHHDWDGAPSGSCVVPASGGPATCLVPCDALPSFHKHGMEGGGWGGGPWEP